MGIRPQGPEHRNPDGGSIEVAEAATRLEALIDVLVSEGLGDTVRAVDVASLMGVEWRKVTKGVTGHPRFHPLIAAAGWEYVPGKGKRGSTFVRVARVPDGTEPLGILYL